VSSSLHRQGSLWAHYTHGAADAGRSVLSQAGTAMPRGGPQTLALTPTSAACQPHPVPVIAAAPFAEVYGTCEWALWLYVCINVTMCHMWHSNCTCIQSGQALPQRWHCHAKVCALPSSAQPTGSDWRTQLPPDSHHRSGLSEEPETMHLNPNHNRAHCLLSSP
jgi:hypothetical protein